MNISISKQFICFQNFFGVLFRLCQGKDQKNFSHFVCFRGQHKRYIAGEQDLSTCCPYHKDKWAECGNLKNKTPFWKSGSIGYRSVSLSPRKTSHCTVQIQLFKNRIQSKQILFIAKTMMFLQIFATCFGKQGCHQAKLYKKYTKGLNNIKWASLTYMQRVFVKTEFLFVFRGQLTKETTFTIRL